MLFSVVALTENVALSSGVSMMLPSLMPNTHASMPASLLKSSSK